MSENELTWDELVEKAFSKDPKEALEYSAMLARYCGVPEELIITKEKLDKYKE